MSNPEVLVERRVDQLAAMGAAQALQFNRIGLEKESLRVSAAGRLAQTPHPQALGAAFTHPHITTDFSEALLELVTPAFTDVTQLMTFLRDIHRFVYGRIGAELLWATSMPCILDGARSIPLAQYGTSNAATMKTVYRRGLGNRYGRSMQVIAGVHFNFSYGDDFWPLYREIRPAAGDGVHFRSESQMAMIRNLQRVGWLVSYLFGASPAICDSFVQGQETDLQRFDANTLYYPYATSLRMGDIGYQNKQEEGTGMKANYDSLDAYIRTLTWAIQTPCPQYEAIGVKVGDRYEQLNENVLQIENEYYSTVRPKQITEWLEKPTHALRRRGIRYVELRSLDVNVFEPLGVNVEQLRFLELLMLYCLLNDSPRISPRERQDIDENLVLTAHRGREPGLRLARGGMPMELRAWAYELLRGMLAPAELLDGGTDGAYTASLRAQLERVAHPELTPSACILQQMRDAGEGFFSFSQRWSEAHQRSLSAEPLAADREAELEEVARASIERQHAIEQADDQDFDTFLQAYLAQQVEAVSVATE